MDLQTIAQVVFSYGAIALFMFFVSALVLMALKALFVARACGSAMVTLAYSAVFVFIVGMLAVGFQVWWVSR